MPSIAYLDFKYERTSTVNKIYDNAITLTALVNDCQIGFYASDGSYIDLSISYDNGMTWTDIHLQDGYNFYYPDPIDAGKTIMIAGRENHHNYGCKGLHIFSDEDNYFNVSGNLTSLLDSDIALVEREWPQVKSYMNNCFESLFCSFYNDSLYRAYVKDASGLIFPDLDPTQYMYARMFSGCTSLETAPVTLTTHVNSSMCCYNMFNGCTSLTTAPELPATTLAFHCYTSMFEGCTSLTTAPELPATTLALTCYSSMFKDCTSLILPPRLSATTLVSNCYNSMFEGCTSLTTAPELPATTLASTCYSSMFKDCESLNYIKILATSWPANTDLEDHLTDWVENVAPTGNFIKDTNTTYEIDSTSGVPIGWTIYNVGEEILDDYTVTLHVNPDNTGSIMNNPVGNNTYIGVFQENSNVTITAHPIKGYGFNGWYNGNTLISGDATYMFTITGDVEYTAKFYEIQDIYYSIFVQQNVDVGTAPTGAGTFVENSSCTITAYNHQDYNFIGWSLNGTIVSTNLSYTFTVDNTYTFIAMYEYNPPAVLYTVTLYSDDDTMGYCSGSGTYESGTSITIQAIPNMGYDFVCWKDENGFEYSTSRALAITVLQNIVLFAEFRASDSYEHQYFTIQAIDDYLQVDINPKNYYNSELHGFDLWYKKNNDNWQQITFDYSEHDYDPHTICILNSGDIVKLHANAHTMNMDPNNYSLQHFGEYSYVQDSVFHIYNQGEPNKSSGAWNYQYGAKFNVYGNILSLIDYQLANNGHPDYPTFDNVVYEPYVFGALFDSTQLQSATNLRIPNATLSEGCYMQMFEYCKSLIAAPQLPATTLAESCYYKMFAECAALTTAPQLPATTLAESCYRFMFAWCYNLIYYPELPATTLANYCYACMFYNCTSLTTAPELNVATLVEGCYLEMFMYCSSLNYIKCTATNLSASSCTTAWVYLVSREGEFIQEANTTWSRGADGIPTTWSVTYDL